MWQELYKLLATLMTSEKKKVKKMLKSFLLHCDSNGRGDWIRTSDLLNPIQVRYAKLRYAPKKKHLL
jgi:hypothetical protein